MAGGFKADQGPDRGEGVLSAGDRNLIKVAGAEDTENVVDLLKIAADAERINMEFEAALRSRWERSYRAYRSEHPQGSKYRMKSYAARSKLFRPKTRVAVRNAMKAAYSALFTTQDLVTISASRESDPVLLASAKVLQEDLSYRLDRTSPRGGMPWMQIALGSVFNATTTGITVSKQFWDWKTRQRTSMRMVPREDGAIDPETGQPLMEQQPVQEQAIEADRPMIDLIPPENVLVDLAAPWLDPAQLSAYFIVRYPMLVTDLRSMIEQGNEDGGKHGAVEWLEISDKALSVVQSDYDAQGVRLAREGGQDSKQRRDSMEGEYSIVWVHENCMRYRGTDYHFWSAGSHVYLSKPIEMEDAYPHLHGGRPYVYGYGAIEPHLIYPQSTVESLQPLQMEANDVVNLRLDSLKQALEPIAKVKHGAMLDYTQLQPGKRGAPGAVVSVRNMDDLDFATWPGPAGQAYAEMANINADMDDLAGTFSGSSVQTNRQLNETVGGMRMLNSSAASTVEFDIAVWAATAGEPMLRQVVHLLQYWESDETILAIAGDRAKVWQRYGISEITDQHLMSEVGVKMNIGMGAIDPMQKMQKLQAATTMLMGVGPAFDRPVKVNAEEFVSEVMGLAGHKDGERFFIFGDPNQQEGEDPGAAEMQAKMALEQLKSQTQLQLAQMNNASEEERERVKAQISLIETLIGQQGSLQQAQLKEHGSMAQRMMQRLGANGSGQNSAPALRGKDEGLPSYMGMMRSVDTMRQEVAMIGQAVSDIARQNQHTAQALQRIAEIIAAPTEIVRDASGRAVGVNKGGMVRRIERDPDTGRPMRLQ